MSCSQWSQRLTVCNCPLIQFAADLLRMKITADTIVHGITTKGNFNESKKVQPDAPGRHMSSEDSQVVAALGPHFDCHALVVACYQPVQQAPSLLGKALFAFVDWASALDGLAAVPTEADLSDHAFEQLGHIVLQRCRRLNELTVKHHSTGSALCEKKTYKKWIHYYNSISQSLPVIHLLYIGMCMYVSPVTCDPNLPQQLLWIGPGHSCCPQGWWECFRPGGCVAVWYGAQRQSQSWSGRWRSRRWHKHSRPSDIHPVRNRPPPPERKGDMELNSAVRKTLWSHSIMNGDANKNK